MDIIKTEEDINGEIQLTTTDFVTGEGTEDMRIEIISDHCSAWTNLTEKQAIELRDKLNEWIDV
jgi:hypothetical protein|tara:strand:- start:699 stop:890 length:192 start_codon:yes stop_codon:yes gene_type:complete